MADASTKTVTGLVRLSFLNIWEPKAMKGGKEKYSASLIIPKNAKWLPQLNEAINAGIEEARKKFGFGTKPLPAKFDMPLRDGDIEKPEDKAYENSYYLSAKSDYQPQVIDAYKKPIEDHSALYSGCYALVAVNFYPYDFEGKKGVAVSLNSLMKIKDGEPLSGRGSAEKDFEDVDVSQYLAEETAGAEDWM